MSWDLDDSETITTSSPSNAIKLKIVINLIFPGKYLIIGVLISHFLLDRTYAVDGGFLDDSVHPNVDTNMR